uniref:Uncharacterized protein n=1 Tax=Arundo donax TaxID=35708 RepID=A0A0A9AXH0_ARUDO
MQEWSLQSPYRSACTIYLHKSTSAFPHNTYLKRQADAEPVQIPLDHSSLATLLCT